MLQCRRLALLPGTALTGCMQPKMPCLQVRQCSWPWRRMHAGNRLRETLYRSMEQHIQTGSRLAVGCGGTPVRNWLATSSGIHSLSPPLSLSLRAS